MSRPARLLHEDTLLAALLVGFVALASLYNATTPPFEMSDELWHYPMVKTLADGNGLPVQDPTNPGPWKQEGSQPPLYYYLAAALTFWIDTSDIDQVLRPNPHVDNGVVTPDGNNNLVVHRLDLEAYPWRGTVLAVHLARLLSTAFGAGAVYFAYRLGIEIFPERRWLALSGAAAMALTPMFVFISGAVNNDSLAAMLAAAALWLMARIARSSSEGPPTTALAAALGITLGAAALTKTSTLGLFGLAGLTMAYSAWKQRRWQILFLEGPLILALAAATAGWWYLRNLQLYGDPLGLNAFIAILGRRARPASLLQLWGERAGFMQSYWGLFGGVNIPMPFALYDVLNGLAIAAAAGVPVALVKMKLREKRSPDQWFPVILSLLWIAGVVLPLILSWARITWSSQGRLVFSAIGCLSLWFMTGLTALLPERPAKMVAVGVLAFMGTLTAAAPMAWIRPRYLPPPQLEAVPEMASYEFSPAGAARPAMRLLGYRINTEAALPGESVEVVLYWEALSEMDRNWSVFVHLEDSAGILAGQRDTYPGVGLLATSDLEPGRRWMDRYIVPISASAYAPEELIVRVGLYDYTTCSTGCERMTVSDGGTAAAIGELALLPADPQSQIPNPVSFNFGGQMSLVGYQIDRRLAGPGDTVTLSLYWRGESPIPHDYTVSVQMLGPDLRNYAQRDNWPLNGARPTSGWLPGEMIAPDRYPMTLSQDIPPGVYSIQVVVYRLTDSGDIERLQLVTPDGRLVDDYVLLTQVRVP